MPVTGVGIPIAPHNSDPLPIKQGGTEGTTAKEAREKLETCGLNVPNTWKQQANFEGNVGLAGEVQVSGTLNLSGDPDITEYLLTGPTPQLNQRYTVGTTSSRAWTLDCDADAHYVMSRRLVDLTGQAADITTTNLVTSASGMYRVSVYLETTTADGAAGTLAVTLGWTDRVGATTSVPISGHSLAATGRDFDHIEIRANSGNITYAVAVTGIYGTSQYAITVRVEAI